MIEVSARQVVIAGVSTRAFAVSAARAGYVVTAVDAFGDLDLRRFAKVIAMRPEHGTRYTPMAAATAADAVTCDLASYTSNFENYPTAVKRLSRGRTLLGNPASVLTRVRNPIGLMRAFRRRGFAVPRTRASAPAGHGSPGSWLLKPRRSGGGHGTRVWRHGQPVPGTCYLQERLAGVPASILFAADGQRAALMGVSRQIVGETAVGASGFRYCGSLLGPAATLFPKGAELKESAARLAQAVTEEFGLRGLNGIDVIVTEDLAYPIEVNPRYSASMELLERAHALSIFNAHAIACGGVLPPVAPRRAQVEGKLIVFARKDLVLGETRGWLDDASLADIPHPGEKIGRGHPICTVYASGPDAASCYERLLRRAGEVYRMTQPGKRPAA